AHHADRQRRRPARGTGGAAEPGVGAGLGRARRRAGGLLGRCARPAPAPFDGTFVAPTSACQADLPGLLPYPEVLRLRAAADRRARYQWPAEGDQREATANPTIAPLRGTGRARIERWAVSMRHATYTGENTSNWSRNQKWMRCWSTSATDSAAWATG